LGAFTLVDLSRTAIEQQAESKAENIYIFACHFDSTKIATNELVNVIMYRQIIRRVENADVYTGDLVVRQQSNRTKGESFYLS
jgi:hypothetical protein